MEAALKKLKEKNAEKAACSMVSTRAGVYTDEASGETKVIFFVPTDEDGDLFAHTESRAFIAIISGKVEGDQISTAGWFSTPLVRNQRISRGTAFDDVITGVLKVYERLNVPVQKKSFPGTERELPAEEFEIRFVATNGEEPKEVHKVRRFKTKEKSGPFQMDMGIVFSAPFPGSLPSIQKSRKSLQQPMARFAPRILSSPLSLVPEGVDIEYYGEPGKILLGSLTADLTHTKPYVSVKRENGCIYVKRTPVAKEKENYAELFVGMPIGSIPSISISKYSGNAHSIAVGLERAKPELVTIEANNDVWGLSVLSLEQNAFAVTPHRNANESCTLASLMEPVGLIKQEAKLNKQVQCDITKITLYACLEEAGGKGGSVMDMYSSMRWKMTGNRHTMKDGLWLRLFLMIPITRWKSA